MPGSDLPDGFVWGAATAAYQIEGAARTDGRGESIWDRFAHTPGHIADGSDGDVACDHYHRYRDDVALLTYLGLDAYRFSIAWPRILPEGRGRVNDAGLDFYDRLVDELLRQRDHAPRHALSLGPAPGPRGRRAAGRAAITALAFADYAAIVARRLGDRVPHMATLNEPLCSSILGYAMGIHAPGRREPLAAVAAAHHLLLAHGLGMAAIRAEAPSIQAGIVLNFEPKHPASAHLLDLDAAAIANDQYNRWFLEPIVGAGLSGRRGAGVGLGPSRGAGRRHGHHRRPHRLPGRELLHAPGHPVSAAPRPDRRDRHRADRRRLGGLSRRPDRGARVRPRPDRGSAAVRHGERGRVRRRPDRPDRRPATRPATSSVTSPPRGSRWTAASRCAATSPGRSSTTSSGPRATPIGSASSTSTSRRRSAGSATAAGTGRRWRDGQGPPGRRSKPRPTRPPRPSAQEAEPDDPADPRPSGCAHRSPGKTGRPAAPRSLWRSSRNPIIPRDLLPRSNSIFNSAVVPFEGGFAGVFRVDDTVRTMDLHVGRSSDGVTWQIDAEPIRFEADGRPRPRDPGHLRACLRPTGHVARGPLLRHVVQRLPRADDRHRLDARTSSRSTSSTTPSCRSTATASCSRAASAGST